MKLVRNIFLATFLFNSSVNAIWFINDTDYPIVLKKHYKSDPAVVICLDANSGKEVLITEGVLRSVTEPDDSPKSNSVYEDDDWGLNIYDYKSENGALSATIHRFSLSYEDDLSDTIVIFRPEYLPHEGMWLAFSYYSVKNLGFKQEKLTKNLILKKVEEYKEFKKQCRSKRISDSQRKRVPFPCNIV